MGLRHRTAICILREQRRKAELQPERPLQQLKLRTAENLRFSSLELKSNYLNRQERDESQKLILRLRQAIQPLSQQERSEPSPTSREYQALQDELLRLTQHMAQYRPRLSHSGLEDIQLPGFPVIEEHSDFLPYRTITISTRNPSRQEHPPIQRLDFSLSDLRSYKLETAAQPSPCPPSLSLVKDIPEAPELLMDETVEIGQVMASLTQHNLARTATQTPTQSIPTDVALSLLDT